MATTFEFPKPMDEVSDPVLLPKDWYNVELTRTPVIRPNATLRDALGDNENPSEEEISAALEADPKAGFNLVVDMSTEHPEDRFAGHEFTIWLPYPSAVDDERFTRGQKVSDRKMQKIESFVIAFGGGIEGTRFVLSEGMKGCVYIDTQKRRDQPDELENYIEHFQAGFKAYQG